MDGALLACSALNFLLAEFVVFIPDRGIGR